MLLVRTAASPVRAALGYLGCLLWLAAAGCGAEDPPPGSPARQGRRADRALRFEAPRGVQELRAGSTLRVSITARDAAGEPVPLEAQGLPRQARYDSHTGSLVFRSEYSQLGEHRFRFVDATGERTGDYWLTVRVQPLSWVALTKGLLLPAEGGTVVVDAGAQRLLHFGPGGRVWARGLGPATPSWSMLSDAGDDPIEPATVLVDDDGRRALVLDAKASSSHIFHLDERRWQRLGGELPRPRERYALTVDVQNRRAFLFGGVDDLGPRNDLHVVDLDGGKWAPVNPQGAAPLRRAGAFAAYDHPRQRLLIVGGDAGFGSEPVRLRDVWAVSLQGRRPTWMELHPAGPPPPARADMVGCHDVLNERLFVWGGVANAKGAMDEAWELRLGVAGRDVFADEWRRVVLAGDPPEATRSHVGFDPAAAGRVVLLSTGAEATPLGPHDLWELGL